MISKILKIIIVLTSIAPVFLTFWFMRFSRRWNYQMKTYLKSPISKEKFETNSKRIVKS